MERSIRERTEEIEQTILCARAAHSAATRGRAVPEPPCPIRTAYQRDRDRIIHCKSFRRLKHKTQVFLSPEGDHYRTRLTHTLEVSQIARTIARALRLNEDLTEAIALGHDLGHTPFGHAGERALSACVGSFHHYEQSVRVCALLERDGRGLNLTQEVLDGIAHHTSGPQASTLEGQVVRICDRIAYINHDIDDAIRAGVLHERDIPQDLCRTLGLTKSERINTLAGAVIANGTDSIGMDPATAGAFERLHSFLYEEVYYNPVAKNEESKVGGIIEHLFRHYVSHPEQIAQEYRHIIESQGVQAAAVDHIAGMTDRYAIQAFETIFIPRPWDV